MHARPVAIAMPCCWTKWSCVPWNQRQHRSIKLGKIGALNCALAIDDHFQSSIKLRVQRCQECHRTVTRAPQLRKRLLGELKYTLLLNRPSQHPCTSIGDILQILLVLYFRYHGLRKWDISPSHFLICKKSLYTTSLIYDKRRMVIAKIITVALN